VPRRESIHPERNPRFPVAEQPASSRPRSGGARRAAPVETERRAAAPGFVEEEHCPRVRLPDDENRLPRDAVRGMPLRQQLRSHRRRQFLFVLASSDRELTRSLVHAFCDTTQAWMETSDGTMGRKLTAVAAESPFELLEARAWVSRARTSTRVRPPDWQPTPSPRSAVDTPTSPIAWTGGSPIWRSLRLEMRSSTPSTITPSCSGSSRVGVDRWGWDDLWPRLDLRIGMPIGPLLGMVGGRRRGRPGLPTPPAPLRRVAARAGVRRRFAPHLRHAHAVELAHEGVPLNVIQRQLWGIPTSASPPSICRGSDNAEIVATVHARKAPTITATTGLRV
jgi:hypothetical protein